MGVVAQMPVLTFEGAAILAARGAYAGCSQASRRQQLGGGLVLSNRYAALEPAAELPQESSLDDDQTAESDSGSSDTCTEEEEEELVPATEEKSSSNPSTLSRQRLSWVVQGRLGSNSISSVPVLACLSGADGGATGLPCSQVQAYIAVFSI
uniref:Uncharacterized protein n=1 Tax=Tetradesmus obliquus TaxID=3088 RepID=A0A383VW44_TETOB|eukprot:jgi/Sobl393_1/12475/SZX68646.1